MPAVPWAPRPDSPLSLAPAQVRSVAIVGGGPSGAVTLDALVAENRFDRIVLFERRHAFGGVWLYDEHPPPTPPAVFLGTPLDPPLAAPARGAAPAVRAPAAQQQRFEHTAAYEKMPTNIIEKVMTFSDRTQWRAGADSQYVDRPHVQQYVADYIARHRGHPAVTLCLDTHVEDIAKVARSGAAVPYRFQVTTRQRAGGADEWRWHDFDAVVVTSGHHHIPWVPRIAGCAEAVQAFPGRFEHSKFYRSGTKYAGKTVVVVGSRISGCDIARSACEHGARVYQVVRSVHNTYSVMRRPGVVLKPEIARFDVAAGQLTVVFADGSRLCNPDHVVFATGYRFSFPFLRRQFGELSRDGVMVPDLYEHTFPVGEPLLAFVGMPIEAISFRVFEVQAVLVARFLAGRVQIASTDEQRRWVQRRVQERGHTRGYHTVGTADAAAYMNGLAQMGAVKDTAGPGRQFPVISDADVAEYARESAKLYASWE